MPRGHGLSAANQLIDKSMNKYTKELSNFVKQPSVSSSGEGISDAASLLSDYMKSAGIATCVKRVPGGYPVVLGKIEEKENRRTILLYGHYDVAPTGPARSGSVIPSVARL